MYLNTYLTSKEDASIGHLLALFFKNMFSSLLFFDTWVFVTSWKEGEIYIITKGIDQPGTKLQIHSSGNMRWHQTHTSALLSISVNTSVCMVNQDPYFSLSIRSCQYVCLRSFFFSDLFLIRIMWLQSSSSM